MSGVFLGTPAAAVPSLGAFADVEDVDLVITQPDRRSGRGTSKNASPVKVAAQQFGFDIAQPSSSEELLAVLKETAKSGGNIVEPVIDAVNAYCTIGEISDIFRATWGEYRETS